MARKRTPKAPTVEGSESTTVQLRIDHRGAEDIVGSGEGFLVLYDPAVVTSKLLDRFRELNPVVHCVLGWAAGHQRGGIVAEPERWTLWGKRDKRESAKLIGELLELGLLRAIAVVPICFGGYGADFRFQCGSLRQEEWNSHHRLRKSGRIPKDEPVFSWITATTPRLVATSTFFLAFTAERKREEFGPGYEVDFSWPAGDYKISGWSFPEEEENEDGMIIDLNVIRLELEPTKLG